MKYLYKAKVIIDIEDGAVTIISSTVPIDVVIREDTYDDNNNYLYYYKPDEIKVNSNISGKYNECLKKVKE